MRGMVLGGSWVFASMVVLACGGSPKPADAPAAPMSDAGAAATSAASGGDAPATSGASSDAGSATSAPSTATTNDSASSAPAAPPPPAHPFAHNAEEATSLMDDAIQARAEKVMACVDDARTRRKDKHAKIVVEIGIDQQGHLIAVKMPGKEKADKPLTDCLMGVLRDAPFPESHAGVITIRKTFEDKAVYK